VSATRFLPEPVSAAASLELQSLRRENEQLRTALASRIVIEQAKGVLAERFALHVDDAFERLRCESRSRRVKLHSLAAAVTSGEAWATSIFPPHEPGRETGTQQHERTRARQPDVNRAAVTPRPVPHDAPSPVGSSPAGDDRPRLVFFTVETSGPCRHVERWLAQVLQHRRNHLKIKLVTVDAQARPELIERFQIECLPTLVLVQNKTVKARLERPRGTHEIKAMLVPWL
jgi:ANTAR domain/Thioredoxin